MRRSKTCWRKTVSTLPRRPVPLAAAVPRQAPRPHPALQLLQGKPMNDDMPSEPIVSTTDAFLPLVLLALSLIFVFIAQIVGVSAQRRAVNDARDRLENDFRNSTPQHEQMIAQSRQVQARLQQLANDLLEVAKTGDPDAKAIVEKWKIQQ